MFALVDDVTCGEFVEPELKFNRQGKVFACLYYGAADYFLEIKNTAHYANLSQKIL
jgi:hypothetical protein